ncbi:hypothetical protein KR059_012076 [Drosophila kikkawai]|nr:hypothetical protein KR059_012076 [Drosophila kikkawai]
MSLNRRKLSVSWSQYYEEMLLDMWERSIRNLEPYTGLTKTQIRRMMAKQLDDAGFIGIEAKEVRNKQENLTKKYRVEAKKLESHWIHFERLHEMFRHCRPANPGRLNI